MAAPLPPKQQRYHILTGGHPSGNVPENRRATLPDKPSIFHVVLHPEEGHEGGPGPAASLGVEGWREGRAETWGEGADPWLVLRREPSPASLQTQPEVTAQVCTAGQSMILRHFVKRKS